MGQALGRLSRPTLGSCCSCPPPGVMNEAILGLNQSAVRRERIDPPARGGDARHVRKLAKKKVQAARARPTEWNFCWSSRNWRAGQLRSGTDGQARWPAPLRSGLGLPFRHPVFTAAQGALADGAASLKDYLRSLVRKSDGDARNASTCGNDRALEMHTAAK